SRDPSVKSHHFKAHEHSMYSKCLYVSLLGLAEYPTISVTNFASDWSDGRAFCALIHHFKPEMVNLFKLMEPKLCIVLAVQLAEKLNMHVDHATFLEPAKDHKNVMAVVFELYKKHDTDEK
ncbi:hypothetical protein KIN20_020010, partial [Parelaphostrongylus tenuis]